MVNLAVVCICERMHRAIRQAAQAEAARKSGEAIVRQAEVLRESEERARAIFDNVGVGIVEVEKDERFVAVNDRACEILGYRREELLNMTVDELTAPEDRDPSARLNAELREGVHNLIECEKHYLKRDGSPLWVHVTITGIRDAAGQWCRGIATFEDISERKRAEDELCRLNRIYAVLSQVNQAVVHVSSQQKLLEQICEVSIEFGKFKMAWVGKINAKTQQVIPIAAAGDEGGYLDKISIYADDRPEGRGPMGTSIREERTYVSNDFQQDPCALPWRDSAIRVGFRAIISLPLRREGKIFGALAVYAGELDCFHDKEVKLLEEVASDVSFALDHVAQELRRQQNEVELKQAKEQAEAANRAKDQFIAVLSHELRTPLTPVLTAVTLLQTREETSDDLRAELELIRRNVQLEAKLIDDLLDVTRISRGIIELHREEVDVHACLMKTLEICRTELVEKGIEVSLSLSAKAYHVWADSARLQQVFWNLLKNAVKFTPEAGRISIRTTNTDQRLKIEVADTGIGIEAEVLSRIFNAFEQGEQTRSRRFGGLGLGLSIAKAVVELHKGSLTAYSEGQNKGSVFTVELEPIASTPGAAICDITPSPKKERQCKILLVEDHADTLRILCRLLEKWGYTVRCTDCVSRALDLAASESFDILISDLGLPDGSGLDIMRQTKERYGLRGVALSGFGTDDDLRQSRAAGFEEHLTKPVGIEGLHAAVERMMAAQRERTSDT
jgi:PAS domain S-box-containing protein